MYSPPKVMVVGGPGVGKATIFQRFISGDMSGSYGEGDILRGRSDLAFGYYRQWMTAQNKQVSVSTFRFITGQSLAWFYRTKPLWSCLC